MPDTPNDNVFERPDTVGFTSDQFSQLIDAIRGNAADRVEAEATIHARALKQTLSPQNETCPEVSVFNPRGDRDHPRPLLVCEFYIGRYPLEPDVLTVQEITLMNQLIPGTYDVTKSDGQVVPFHVIPRYRMDGKTIERLDLAFPCADEEQRQNFPLFRLMLQEVVDQQAVKQILASAP